jgi:hypothetical protein
MARWRGGKVRCFPVVEVMTTSLAPSMDDTRGNDRTMSYALCSACNVGTLWTISMRHEK